MKASKNMPMASAPFVFDAEGKVAWDKMWTDFCVLAKEGGPPHRGEMLLPKENVDITHPNYSKVTEEITRAYKQLIPYKFEMEKGWVEIALHTPNMAKWFCTIVLSENVFCERKGRKISLPLHQDYLLEKEIKNVVTVVAKAYHYWYFHRTDFDKLLIHLTGKDFKFKRS